jgi:MoxR-like ATPase
MMSHYPFRLVNDEREGPLEAPDLLMKRPFVAVDTTLAANASRFVPGEQLETAINTAIAVGEPLLITGEPGTGKTQAAYYVAYKLGLEPVLHFQVKSDGSARDLLYHFETVLYFHDAYLSKSDTPLNKDNYVRPRALWEAMASPYPRVLLIDEIDKAPRDFPNDLLHELNQMEFTIAETGQKISAPRAQRPIVVITSNSERRLPEPFLRRCVYHHIRLDDDLVFKAVEKRRDEYAALSPDVVKMAVQRFLALRDRPLRKRPSTGELLVWLRVLALSVGTYPERLDRDLSKLPYLGVLLKDHQDIEELGSHTHAT